MVVERAPKYIVGGRKIWYPNDSLSLLNFKAKYETAWLPFFLPLLDFGGRYETLRPLRLNQLVYLSVMLLKIELLKQSTRHCGPRD